MATTTSHNKKSSSVKRILSEARELARDDSSEYAAHPLDDNIFEWHYTLRGPSGTEFEDGIYHGRILLPAEYPFRPPSVMVLTPNGRWECGKKICLTFTGFHEEMWQPAWGIRTALLGVQTFMGAKAEAAAGVGSLEYTREQRRKLAEVSRDWTCGVCQRKNAELLAEQEAKAAAKGGGGGGAAAGGQRRLESLPEGLSVDASGEGGGGNDDGKGASGSTEVGGHGADASEGAVVLQDSEVGVAVAGAPKLTSPPSGDAPGNDGRGLNAGVVGSAAAPDDGAHTRPAEAASAGSFVEADATSRGGEARLASTATSGSARANIVEPNGVAATRPETGDPQVQSASTTVAGRQNDALPSSSLRGRGPRASRTNPIAATNDGIPANATPATPTATTITSTPSERYLAMLDRAIATVVLLLGALLVRRVL